MRAPFESKLGGLTDVIQEIARGLQGLGRPGEDRRSLPRTLAMALAAEWVVVRDHDGAWIAVGRHGIGDRFPGEPASRRIDFGLIERLPRARLVRLAGPVLGRSARFAGSGIREVLIYSDSACAGHGALVVIALSNRLAVEPHDLEGLLRTWVALGALRSWIGQAQARDHLVEVGMRAACALHDLRHELTVMSLEIDRLSNERASIPDACLARIRTAIRAARALCESELEPGARAETAPCRIAELLRNVAFAARSVSGRGASVRLEIHCDGSLEFRVDRGLLSRIMRNLVLNAIENSPDGERVTIEAERGSEAELLLRVIDRGRGMSAADREDLFRFGRSGRGGWGIGTSSIGSCARRIGATPAIESLRGSGTRVELRVPPAGRGARA